MFPSVLSPTTIHKTQTMQLAIISDIHGNLPALQAVLADIASRGVHTVYHLGDLVGYNPFPNEVVNLVRQLDLPGVVGNYDLAVASEVPDSLEVYLNPTISPMAQEIYRWTKARTTRETRQYLLGLPQQVRLTIGDWQLLLTHGSPRRLREYVRPLMSDAELEDILAGESAQVILTGHTHRPMVRQVNGKWLINPGSVGFPKDGDPRAAYALLEVRVDLQVHIARVVYDVEQTARALVAEGLPSQAAEDLRHGRRLKRVP